MDTLTHALSGALIGRATAARTPGAQALPVDRRMLIGGLAAAFPDLDFVTSYLTPLAYLHHHRGVTHSLLLLPLWAVVLSVVFALLWRGKPPWRAYLGVTALGIAAHIAGDLITSFGTMIFAPLSDARYALSATFIIDLWFTGIIVLGLIASAIWRSLRAPAIIATAMLAGYVGFQVVLQHRAIEFGEEYARNHGMPQASVTAMPRPVSPFNWTVVIADHDAFYYAHVNLIRKQVLSESDAAGFIRRLDAAYRPLDDAAWIRAERYGGRTDDVTFAREAYAQPDFRFFRWFAAYPALLSIDMGSAQQRCVWFHDLRFVTPGRDATPFRYGMCRDPAGAWTPFQLVGGKKRLVY